MLNLFQHRTMKQIKGGYTYILGNNNLTLYIGVTNNLIKRIYEHKQALVPGFTKRYNLHKLFYFEVYPSIQEAIAREKQLKRWHREWKINLIKEKNPDFKDLFISLL